MAQNMYKVYVHVYVPDCGVCVHVHSACACSCACACAHVYMHVLLRVPYACVMHQD